MRGQTDSPWFRVQTCTDLLHGPAPSDSPAYHLCVSVVQCLCMTSRYTCMRMSNRERPTCMAFNKQTVDQTTGKWQTFEQARIAGIQNIPMVTSKCNSLILLALSPGLGLYLIQHQHPRCQPLQPGERLGTKQRRYAWVCAPGFCLSKTGSYRTLQCEDCLDALLGSISLSTSINAQSSALLTRPEAHTQYCMLEAVLCYMSRNGVMSYDI